MVGSTEIGQKRFKVVGLTIFAQMVGPTDEFCWTEPVLITLISIKPEHDIIPKRPMSKVQGVASEEEKAVHRLLVSSNHLPVQCPPFSAR
jgi:hypothetical protein